MEKPNQQTDSKFWHKSKTCVSSGVSQYTNGLYMLKIIPSKGESSWLKMSILDKYRVE